MRHRFLAPLLFWACGARTLIDLPDGGTPPIADAAIDRGADVRDATRPDVPDVTPVRPCPPAPQPVRLCTGTAPGRRPLTQDYDHVYWAADTKILSVSKCGGVPVALAATQSSSGVVSIGATLYWSKITRPGAIWHVPTSGGTSMALLTIDATFSEPSTDGVSLFFFGGGALHRAELDGSFQQLMLPFVVGPIAVDEAYVYGNDSAFNLVRARKDGSGGVTVVNPMARLDAIALDPLSVFFSSGGAIWSVAKLGSPRQAMAKAVTLSIAVDDTHVYWGEQTAIGRASKTQPGQSMLAKTADVNAIIVDPFSVYWSTGDGSVWRMDKP